MILVHNQLYLFLIFKKRLLIHSPVSITVFFLAHQFFILKELPSIHLTAIIRIMFLLYPEFILVKIHLQIRLLIFVFIIGLQNQFDLFKIGGLFQIPVSLGVVNHFHQFAFLKGPDPVETSRISGIFSYLFWETFRIKIRKVIFCPIEIRIFFLVNGHIIFKSGAYIEHFVRVCVLFLFKGFFIFKGHYNLKPAVKIHVLFLLYNDAFFKKAISFHICVPVRIQTAFPGKTFRVKEGNFFHLPVTIQVFFSFHGLFILKSRPNVYLLIRIRILC